MDCEVAADADEVDVSLLCFPSLCLALESVEVSLC